MKVLLHFLLAISVLSAVPAMSQSKDSSITAIYTDFKSYWASSTASNNPLLPDTSHNLLAFRFRNGTYSTGVNDAMLPKKLGSATASKIPMMLMTTSISTKVKAAAQSSPDA